MGYLEMTMVETSLKARLSMPAGQPVELIVGRRRGQSIALPAVYVDDGDARRLTAAERAQVGRAGKLLADAIGGVPVDELELQNAVDLLHRLSRESEGEPRFRLADGRELAGDGVAYRARLD